MGRTRACALRCAQAAHPFNSFPLNACRNSAVPCLNYNCSAFVLFGEIGDRGAEIDSRRSLDANVCASRTYVNFVRNSKWNRDSQLLTDASECEVHGFWCARCVPCVCFWLFRCCNTSLNRTHPLNKSFTLVAFGSLAAQLHSFVAYARVHFPSNVHKFPQFHMACNLPTMRRVLFLRSSVLPVCARKAKRQSHRFLGF